MILLGLLLLVAGAVTAAVSHDPRIDRLGYIVAVIGVVFAVVGVILLVVNGGSVGSFDAAGSSWT